MADPLYEPCRQRYAGFRAGDLPNASTIADGQTVTLKEGDEIPGIDLLMTCANEKNRGGIDSSTVRCIPRADP
jgi:hypothetical protein